MNIWFVSGFGILQIKLIWTFMYKLLCGHTFSFVLDIYLGVWFSLFGCYNKMPLTGVVYKEEKFISHNPGGWKSKIRVLVWLGEGALFMVTDFSLCPHMVEEARKLCGICFKITLIPFMRALIYDVSSSSIS